MKKYETFELIFHGTEPTGSHVDINLKVLFSINGIKTEVNGFYAGNHTNVHVKEI